MARRLLQQSTRSVGGRAAQPQSRQHRSRVARSPRWFSGFGAKSEMGAKFTTEGQNFPKFPQLFFRNRAKNPQRPVKKAKFSPDLGPFSKIAKFSPNPQIGPNQILRAKFSQFGTDFPKSGNTALTSLKWKAGIKLNVFGKI